MIGRTNAGGGGVPEGYILDLCGSISVSGSYTTPLYQTSTGHRMACNSNNEVVLVMQAGTTTDYENMFFTLVSAPDNITLVADDYRTGNTAGSQRHYCCYLTNVTKKINIAVDISTRHSNTDCVQCDLTITYA